MKRTWPVLKKKTKQKIYSMQYNIHTAHCDICTNYKTIAWWITTTQIKKQHSPSTSKVPSYFPLLSYSFPKHFFQFAFPPAAYKISSSSISSVLLSFVKVLNFGSLNFVLFGMCSVISSFIFHFLVTNEISMLLYVYWPFVYPPSWSVLDFCSWFYWGVLYIFGISVTRL